VAEKDYGDGRRGRGEERGKGGEDEKAVVRLSCMERGDERP
jgi:hypothetical protein